MPGTPTPNLGLPTPTVGGDNGVWGYEYLAAMAILDGLGVVPTINISVNSVAVVGISPETVIRVTTAGVDVTFSLLPPALCLNRIWTMKKVDGAAGRAIMLAPAGVFIDGQPSWIRAQQYSYVRVVSNGVGYDVIGNN